jgi:putative CocE/NonD family hydrolase
MCAGRLSARTGRSAEPPISAADFALRGEDKIAPRSAMYDEARAFLFEGLEPRFATRVIRSCFIPMRDGVRLSTDFHIPLGATLPLPVILARTPYDKRRASGSTPGTLFAEQGFIYAVQDVRGRCESEGRFVACTGQDREDGYDTVAWLAAQPWCNGRIGAIGSSYVGETAAKLAAMRHPAHRASIIMFDGAYAAGPAYNGAFMQAGAAMLRSLFEWFRDLVPAISYGPPAGIDRQAWFRSAASQAYSTQPVAQPPIDLDATLRTLPVADMLDRTGAAPSEFAAMMRANDRPKSRYWAEQRFLDARDRFEAPALHLTGNEDQGGSGPRLFNLMRTNAASPRARDNQHLIFAASPHSGHARSSSHMIRGARDFGDTRFPYFKTFVDWFGHWLRDDPAPPGEWPKARFFVTGRNQWDEASAYPPVDARPLRLWLHGGTGRAGTLHTTAPSEDAPAHYRYDPADPTPSDLPGAGAQLIGVGFADRAPLEARPDLLVYTSPPLGADLEIVGPIAVELSVSSSARDTDFVAVLLEVDAAGRAINITHGITRMRWREGLDRKLLMTPGEIYAARIDLWFANIRIARGNRLRLHIASSHFPFFDRNLNTGDDNYTTTSMKVADNYVHHAPQTPSCLILSARGAVPVL